MVSGRSRKRPLSKYGDIPHILLQEDSTDSVEDGRENPFLESLNNDDQTEDIKNVYDDDSRGRKLLNVPAPKEINTPSRQPNLQNDGSPFGRRAVSTERGRSRSTEPSRSRSRSRSQYSGGSDGALIDALGDDEEADVSALKDDIKKAIGGKSGEGSWLKPQHAENKSVKSTDSLDSSSFVRKSNDIELGTLNPTSSIQKARFIPSIHEVSSIRSFDNDSSFRGSFIDRITSKVKGLGLPDGNTGQTSQHNQPRIDSLLEKTDDGENSHEPTIPIPKRIRLYGKSMGVFSEHNTYRISCSHILNHPFYLTAEKFILLLQTALLAYRQWNPRVLHGYVVLGMNWADWLLLVLNVYYTFDMFFGMIAYGFWDDSQMFEANHWRYVSFYELTGIKNLQNYFLGQSTQNEDAEKIERNFKHSLTIKPQEVYQDEFHRAYMRKSWNRVDFVSTVSFWISFFLMITRADVKAGFPLFRALSCLRIIRVTSFANRIAMILKSIKLGFPQITDVFLFLSYFLCFFAILGIQSFKSSLRRWCVWTNPNDPSDTYVTNQNCGGYYELINGELTKQTFIRDGGPGNGPKGFLCPVNSKCMTLQNANGNTYGFDNILTSAQMTFVVLSGNTFSNIMYSTMDTDSMAAALFFIFGIFFLLLWLINLLIAVISESFRIVMGKEPNPTTARDVVDDDFELDWKFPKRKYSTIYIDLKFVFDILILSSAILMCLRDLDTSEADLHDEFKAQAIISWILLFEMVFRFSVYFPSWRTFFTIKRNWVDLFLALITSIVSIPVVHDKLGRGYDWLRIFFLIRLYRTIISVKFTRRLWARIWKNISIIMNLSLFYFMILFLVSIIFSRYFENFANEDDIADMAYPFHTLPNTFLGLFTITTTENWSNLMFGMQGIAPNRTAIFFGAILFMTWFLLSNSIILNIFIAIIGHSLSVSETRKRKEQVQKFVLMDFPKRLKALTVDSVIVGLRSRLFFKDPQSKEDRHQEIQKLLLNGAAVQAFLKDELDQLEANDGIEPDHDHEPVRELGRSRFYSFFQIHYRRFLNSGILKRSLQAFGSVLSVTKAKDNPFYKKKINFTNTNQNFSSLAERYNFETQRSEQERAMFLKNNPSFNTALYILHPRQPLRRLCQRVVASSSGKRYDGVEPNRIANFIFTLTASICTLLLIVIACYNTPLYRQEHGVSMWNWAVYVELAIGILFMFEFITKVFADGFIFTPNAYARNVWNVIDFIVLLCIWINFIAISKGNESLSRIVRGLEALRALRLLAISEDSKEIFQKVLLAGFGKILGASFLSFTLLFPFSVWGLNLFTGRLGVCNDGNLGLEGCINEYSTTVFNWDILAPRSYGSPQLELNRFASALLTLFEIISLEGWTDLLSNMVNSTGIGTPAVSYASPENAIFICAFIFIGMIFIMSLFVSVIINNYSSLTGSAFLTIQQTSWLEVRKLLGQITPRTRPDTDRLGPFRSFCFKYAVKKNKYVTVSFHTLLWIHILAILLEKYPSNDALDDFRYSVYFCSSTLFFLLSNLKLIALGPRIFFKIRWNVYEYIVFLGAFGTSFAAFFISRNNIFANINKLFLVGIFTVLIHISSRLSHLLKIVSASFPSLLSLIFTWFVVFLVYAIAMNQIFGLTRLGPNTTGNINLRTVPKALILLFKSSFGEGWNYVMKDFAVEYPFCVQSQGNLYNTTDCGNQQYAYILFISWNIISMYIFVNMFISLIFESFSYVYANNTGTTSLSREEIRRFKVAWQKFDPLGTGYIEADDLSRFLRSLNGYFAFKVFDGKWSIPELVKNFKISRVLISDDVNEIHMKMRDLERALGKLDAFKVQERKRAYNRFVEEANLNMDLYDEPGISFHRVIWQIPLYSRFDETNCLTLTDFLDRLIISRKLNKRIQYRHYLNVMGMIVHRWRFLKAKNPGKILNFKYERVCKAETSDEFESPFFHKPSTPFGNSGSSSDNYIVTEDGYWSPSKASVNFFNHKDLADRWPEDLDETETFDEIAHGLENSQWKKEIKAANEDFEDFLKTSQKLKRKSSNEEEKSLSDNESLAEGGDASKRLSTGDGRKLV